MNSWAYKPIVTVVDVLDIGACIDGVKAFVLRHGRAIVGKASDFLDSEWIQRAAINGYGYGYGYGDGDGYGDGYGYGYGDGDGDGRAALAAGSGEGEKR